MQHLASFASRLRFASVIVLASGLGACSRPSPPTLKPESATVTAVTPAGVELRVVLDVTNPNDFPLTAQNVSAHLVLGGTLGDVDLGTTSIPQAVTFPAKATTTLATPISMGWTNLAELAALTATTPDVSYAVDGNVTLGGGALQVTLPYHLTGNVSSADIMQSAMRSLPQMPGFAPPQPAPR